MREMRVALVSALVSALVLVGALVPSAEAAVTVSPSSSFAFPPTPTTGSALQTFTITAHDRDSIVSLSGADGSGADGRPFEDPAFVYHGQPQFPLKAGTSQSFQIRFRPFHEGQFQATAMLTDQPVDSNSQNDGPPVLTPLTFTGFGLPSGGPVSNPLTAAPSTASVTRRGLGVKLKCALACSVSVSGTLAVPANASAASSTRLAPTRATLKAGRATTVVIKLSKAQRKAIKKAKHKKRKITAKVKVKVTPTGGKATTKSLKLRVK
jgi:hypothetical protein